MMLTISCQKELPDSIKNVEVNQGGQTPNPTPTPSPAPELKMSLDVNTLEFAAGNGSKIFRISSNTLWAVSSDKNWCSVSPTSGSGDGSVTISVEENTSTSERTATITAESATIKRTIAVTQNGATPITPPPSQDRIFTVGGVTFKMIYVEGGTFTMGATSEQDDDGWDYEMLTHSVTLSSYSIGETEVTQALWQAVMGQKPTSDGSQWNSTYGLGSNYPAYYVSWNDCQDFIRRLNSLTGENFRLPTEAEWEYAAGGGNMSRGYRYAGSNSIDNVAWYSGKNELPENVSTDHFDYIKIGRYVAELGPLDSLTTNQRMMKRLADGRVKDITEWFRRNKKVVEVEKNPTE